MTIYLYRGFYELELHLSRYWAEVDLSIWRLHLQLEFGFGRVFGLSVEHRAKMGEWVFIFPLASAYFQSHIRRTSVCPQRPR